VSDRGQRYRPHIGWTGDTGAADAGVVSVVSGDHSRANALAAVFGADGHDDLDRALADPRVSAVYVSSINSAHHRQELTAIAARKHVLCEKQLALNAAEANELIDAARRAGVILATNHHMRNSLPHRLMRDAVAAGDIGTPVAAIVQHAVRLPLAAQRWRTSDPGAGAGAALDLAVHDADCLRFTLSQDPQTVMATTTSGLMTAPSIDETISGTAIFGEDIHASFVESFVTGHASTQIQILGTDGALVGLGIQSMQPVGTLLHVCNGTPRTVELGRREDLYVVGVRRFVAAALGGGPPAATGADGAWSLAFATAALESADKGLRCRVIPPRLGASVA
jgi:1,5-anhydro-D-fructose reductase (1,5-anhydro-D-mannitol-forming)